MRSAVHRDLRRVAPVLPRGPVTQRSVPVLRALQGLADRAAGIVGRARGRADVEVDVFGPVSMRLHRPPGPATSPTPALLWIHGGGYVIGNAAQEDAFCRLVARRVGVVVASVDYRLAPEHPFPIPLHDCHDALVRLAARDDVDEHRVVIGGASAGGGLAAALAGLAHERGEVTPILQLLSYPMLDDRTALRSDVDEAHFRLWNNASNLVGWRSYLGVEPGSPDVDPLAAPARRDDLSALPPAWVGVGTLDLFLDEDRGYAERLRAAGVECRLSVVEGAFHGFDSVLPQAAVSRRYRDDMVDAMTAALERR